MTIHYVGFTTGSSSRAYNFLVKDTPSEQREFTVTIQMKSFRSTTLKFQDGPDICFSRLKSELERETEEARASSSLSIEDTDVREFLEKRYPHKRS